MAKSFKNYPRWDDMKRKNILIVLLLTYIFVY
jgi:hypothetical protein